jgi:glucosamine--fructose-6-phosphate aminotransferase (isomerizing)
MIARVHTLGAETLIFTDKSNKEAASMKGTRAIVLPTALHRKSAVPEELYTPLPYIVPAQILAACLAEEKGLNPDQPRALEKVTRTM